ncbi:Zinc finger protein [Dirofilaria immitis]|nr:Zinc finger protein [Dirofilaria immitis]
MRKKQAKPAKRLAGVVFPDEDSSTGESREVLSPIRRSSSLTPPIHSRITSATEKPDDSAGTPLRVFAMKNTADISDNNVPPFKISKYESDNFGKYCRDGEHLRFTRSHFAARHSSLSRYSSRIVASYPVPMISRASDHHNSFLSMLTATRNSAQSNSFDIPAASVSLSDKSIESADLESPLKRLERCVRANSEAGCSTFGLYKSGKPSTPTRYALTQSRPNTNSMKLRFGYDSTKTSAADALDELSQLVHRIGTTKLPVPAASSKCIPNSITSNVFTCLKCAQQFDTLDELVLHISTTKHFTRGSTKNFDAIAPWERNRVAASLEKQVASSNFLASLFYAQKCFEVPQDLSQKTLTIVFERAVHADDKTVLSVALDLCLCDLSFPSLKSRCEMSSISSAQTMEHDMLLLQNSNSFIQETNLMVLRHSGAKDRKILSEVTLTDRGLLNFSNSNPYT